MIRHDFGFRSRRNGAHRITARFQQLAERPTSSDEALRPSAEAMLRDLAFVLHVTRQLKEEMIQDKKATASDAW